MVSTEETTTDNRPINPYAHVYRGFVEQTKDHRLVVEHDLGLHRTLYVGAPGTGMWSWRVITSPGYLFTVGDVADGFSFSRVLDMMRFFARPDRSLGYYSDGSPSIDFRYWAEKLLGEQRNLAQEYSSAVFLRHVTESLDEIEEYGSHNGQDVNREQLLNEARWVSEEERYARHWLRRDHIQAVFGQDACWEWDLRDYTHSFLIACYAIELTVRLYQEHTAKHPPGEDYVLVEGGLVSNDPALPVYDLDVLDSDCSDQEIADELVSLYERILDHGDHRRGVAQRLLDVLPRIRQRVHRPEDLDALAEADDAYQHRVERAKRIE